MKLLHPLLHVVAFTPACLLSSAVFAGSDSVDTRDIYTLSTVKADFASARRIGSRKAGLACLPAGSFHWRDAKPGMADAVDDVSAVLHGQAAAHVSLQEDFRGDGAGASRYRIVATIEDFSLDGCIKAWGLAATVTKRTNLAGHARVKVRWDVTEPRNPSNAASATYETDYEVKSKTGDAADALLLGLRLNTAQFVRGQWPRQP